MSLPDDLTRAAPTGEGFVALIVAQTQMRAASALEAVALSGGRTLRRVDWHAAAEAVAGASRRAVVLIEATGVDEALLAATLPAIARAAADGAMPVVVALEDAQIDVVGASLLGAGTQLLCLPTMADRVAALALAAEGLGRTALHDPLSEGEAARLARLNAEVARIAEVLARLSRRDSVPEATAAAARVGDRAMRYDAGAREPLETIDPREIRRTIRARRMRDDVFGAALFEDPAWDMMLDLFAAHLERAQVSVSSLCIAAAVAPTTALRWIGKMTDAGLFTREPDPFDRRRAYMALSRGAVERMQAHLSALRHAGLALA